MSTNAPSLTFPDTSYGGGDAGMVPGGTTFFFRAAFCCTSKSGRRLRSFQRRSARAQARTRVHRRESDGSSGDGTDDAEAGDAEQADEVSTCVERGPDSPFNTRVGTADVPNCVDPETGVGQFSFEFEKAPVGYTHCCGRCCIPKPRPAAALVFAAVNCITSVSACHFFLLPVPASSSCF
jgi:hypothetical protein